MHTSDLINEYLSITGRPAATLTVDEYLKFKNLQQNNNYHYHTNYNPEDMINNSVNNNDFISSIPNDAIKEPKKSVDKISDKDIEPIKPNSKSNIVTSSPDINCIRAMIKRIPS